MWGQRVGSALRASYLSVEDPSGLQHRLHSVGSVHRHSGLLHDDTKLGGIGILQWCSNATGSHLPVRQVGSLSLMANVVT